MGCFLKVSSVVSKACLIKRRFEKCSTEEFSSGITMEKLLLFSFLFAGVLAIAAAGNCCLAL